MSKITIERPTDPKIHAEAGFDHAIHWFGDVIRPGYRSSYSRIERNYDQERPLWGLLAFLAGEGFYSLDDLTDALTALQDGTVGDESTEVQRVAGIVVQVKHTADR